MKQQTEIPEYIQQDKQLIQMYQSGMIRCNNYSLQFGDLFVKEAEYITEQINKLLPNVQKQFLSLQTIKQLSEYLLILRSSKALPITLQQQPFIHQTASQTIQRPYTAYDQDYYILQQELNGEQLLNQIRDTLQLDAQVYRSYGGYILAKQKKEVKYEEEQEYQVEDEEMKEIEMVHTPNAHTIEDLANFLNIKKQQTFKLVCYQLQNKLIFCFIRGDKNISVQKLQQFLGLNPFSDTLQMAEPELLEQHGIVPGFGGLVNVKQANNMTIIFDNSCKNVKNVVIGANKLDYHWKNYNYERDTKNVMKYVNWVDVAEDNIKINEELYDIYAEYYSYPQYPIKLVGEQNQQQIYQIQQLRLRLTEIIKQQPRIHNVVYVNVSIPPKFKEDYNNCLEIAKQLPGYKIIDDRPKVSTQIKINMIKDSKISKIIILNGKLIKENKMSQIIFDGGEDYQEEIISLQ